VDSVNIQRVRIGITGLACVLLVVLFAAAIVGFRNEDPAAANDSALANVADQPKDPLAELGVAPGGPPASDTPTQPASPNP
jgi:hypothetical protein